MMMTNIFDFMVDAEGEFVRYGIHIPGHPFYEEIGMPFYIDPESGVIFDSSGNPAIITTGLIDSYDWEILDE
jgi:hypothetical protein